MVAEIKQWNSIWGKAQVVGTSNLNGEVFLVKYEELELPNIVRPNEIEGRIKNEELMWKSRESRGSQVEGPVSTNLDSNIEKYASQFPPMRKAKIISSLSKLVRSDGDITSRSDLIERMVKEGANVTLVSGVRSLQLPSGAYIEQTRLTKTGIDYAEFLMAEIQEF